MISFIFFSHFYICIVGSISLRLITFYWGWICIQAETGRIMSGFSEVVWVVLCQVYRNKTQRRIAGKWEKKEKKNMLKGKESNNNGFVFSLFTSMKFRSMCINRTFFIQTDWKQRHRLAVALLLKWLLFLVDHFCDWIFSHYSISIFLLAAFFIQFFYVVSSFFSFCHVRCALCF